MVDNSRTLMVVKLVDHRPCDPEAASPGAGHEGAAPAQRRWSRRSLFQRQWVKGDHTWTPKTVPYMAIIHVRLPYFGSSENQPEISLKNFSCLESWPIKKIMFGSESGSVKTQEWCGASFNCIANLSSSSCFAKEIAHLPQPFWGSVLRWAQFTYSYSVLALLGSPWRPWAQSACFLLAWAKALKWNLNGIGAHGIYFWLGSYQHKLPCLDEMGVLDNPKEWFPTKDYNLGFWPSSFHPLARCLPGQSSVHWGRAQRLLAASFSFRWAVV